MEERYNAPWRGVLARMMARADQTGIIRMPEVAVSAIALERRHIDVVLRCPINGCEVFSNEKSISRIQQGGELARTSQYTCQHIYPPRASSHLNNA